LQERLASPIVERAVLCHCVLPRALDYGCGPRGDGVARLRVCSFDGAQGAFAPRKARDKKTARSCCRQLDCPRSDSDRASTRAISTAGLRLTSDGLSVILRRQARVSASAPSSVTKGGRRHRHQVVCGIAYVAALVHHPFAPQRHRRTRHRSAAGTFEPRGNGALHARRDRVHRRD